MYSLEPYKSLRSRYTCPACNFKHIFTRYVYNGTADYLADDVGRCNREGKCTYHKTPRQYFTENPSAEKKVYVQREVVVRETFYIDKLQAVKSFKQYQNNNFVLYLSNKFGITEADRLVSMYKIGTSVKWAGATIFWQIDTLGVYHTGKIMLYDVNTCKRVKQPFDHIYWAHNSTMNYDTHQVEQCLFGLHLIQEFNKPIAIVESEKTAVLMAHYCDRYNWLSVGTINGLSVKKLEPLLNHNVTLFPDLGKGYEVWAQKALGFKNIKVSNYLNEIATPEQLANGLDIADFIGLQNFNIGAI